MTLVTAELPILPARVYASMWIVDCTRCKNAEALPPGEPLWACSYCGFAAQVQWPDQPFRYAVARLLAMRPIPYTRNWNPGETVADLLEENAVHGLLDEMGPGLVLAADDAGFIADRLPAAANLREVGA